MLSPRISLGEFLRSRRERLVPEDAGLPSHGRRRTPGLRREEVAQLANIGTSWYTSLEQGRSVNPSEDVLNNIATALQLTEDERRYLHLLAQPVEQSKLETSELSVALKRTIIALDPNPAFIMEKWWDLLFWNEAAELVFRLPSFSTNIQQGPNWLRRFLTDPELKSNTSDWENKAKIMIANFRTDYAFYSNDEHFKNLIEEFTQVSVLFRETWPRHDVQVVTDCHKQWHDPRIGEMEFEHVVLQPSTELDVKIMIYTASAETAKRLANLRGSSSNLISFIE
ncbi:helix-turn-helix domain-containing protein [Alicyclobacillus sp. TC]|uniref:Transcriptional regulator with XRE-family HTH domain n=1 Tax=Alicyclobacillus tolerans TaxID=90970 RepID=A0ABT9LZ97_9BACL|nr:MULTISPECIES: helix-turn-helix transcriptional regulator [Alicyclobacillus]MDP9729588.1 transcriptional regulator with XRE-family HTH domain [Alicyclobacillus tengchongensis]QRF23559.1 helix-turn-helix domain-containing protein [Alicyclobacillus sp. TC]